MFLARLLKYLLYVVVRWLYLAKARIKGFFSDHFFSRSLQSRLVECHIISGSTG